MTDGEGMPSEGEWLEGRHRNSPSRAPSADPTLNHVNLILCDLCLDGVGGECHVPGCAMWLNSAPDLELRSKCEGIFPIP